MKSQKFVRMKRFVPRMNPATIPFRDAAHFQVDNPSWTLCHGVIQSKGLDKPFAWLERMGMVFDRTHQMLIPAKEFYAIHKVAAHAVNRYTVKEARANMDLYRNYHRWF